MAYQYTPNNWNVYDESKSYEENKANDAVITKKKLDRLEEGVKRASADIVVGHVDVVEGAAPEGTFEVNTITGTRVLNLTLPAGSQGARGPKGDKGDGFTIDKVYTSAEEMRAGYATDDVKIGGFVAIASDVNKEDNATLWVKSNTEYKFIMDLSGATGITGPQGPQGEPGATGARGVDGKDGLSAFEIWAAQEGNEGKNEIDFFESLVGPAGAVGPQGEQGPAGEAGPQGPQGEQGPIGETGPQGETGATGEQGPVGEAGKDGADGKSAYEIWASLGNEGKTEEDFIASLKGEIGPEGPQGPQGETGPQGEQGPAGEAGKDGNPGETGPQGPQGEQGPAGEAGKDGVDGKSAYEIWLALEGNEGKTEEDFIASLKGEKGEQGPIGETGAQGETGATGADGKSAYETWSLLEGNEGKTEEDFIASLKGEQGPAGEAGKDGADGKSAYEVWLTLGNEGKTEDEFINSLKGETGETGPAGETGTTGADGKSAYEVWLALGNEGTEEEFINSLKGDTGEQGPQGETGPAGADGEQGPAGADGKSAYEVWLALEGNEGKTEDEFINSLKGEASESGSNAKVYSLGRLPVAGLTIERTVGSKTTLFVDIIGFEHVEIYMVSENSAIFVVDGVVEVANTIDTNSITLQNTDGKDIILTVKDSIITITSSSASPNIYAYY